MIKISVLQESNAELNISLNLMEHLEEGQQSQQPLERNPNPFRSMRDYRVSVSPTNAPLGSTYNPSWGNHTNSSWEPRPPQYAPSSHPQYAFLSQPQPPQSTSPVEQAILNLTKLVGDFVEEHKTFSAQLYQRINNFENSLNKKLVGLQSEMDHKFDNLQSEIDRKLDNL